MSHSLDASRLVRSSALLQGVERCLKPLIKILKKNNKINKYTNKFLIKLRNNILKCAKEFYIIMGQSFHMPISLYVLTILSKCYKKCQCLILNNDEISSNDEDSEIISDSEEFLDSKDISFKINRKKDSSIKYNTRL